MTVTQIYGIEGYEDAKLEVTLSREDVERLKETRDGDWARDSVNFTYHVFPLFNAIIVEAEK